MGWEERRQHKRAYVRITVECRGKTSWQMVEARDISVGGMFVVTDKVEAPNTELKIMFDFGTGEGNKQFVQAEGVVAWTRPKEIHDEQGNVLQAGMGIRFTKLSPLSSKDFINQVVKKLEEKKDA